MYLDLTIDQDTDKIDEDILHQFSKYLQSKESDLLQYYYECELQAQWAIPISDFQ